MNATAPTIPDTTGPTTAGTTPLRVNLVLHPDNSGWIIEKIALKLQEHLAAFGVETSISAQQRADVDLNHWMSYAFSNERCLTRSSMFITHIDDPYKASLVKKVLESGMDVGMCMSRDTVRQLVNFGVREKSLCYVSPAHDNELAPRRIRIGITTRIYADGRKREWMLVRLAKEMSLACFSFEIFGKGWESVVEDLRAGGAQVEYFPGTTDYRGDYRLMLERIPQFDYYLYIGMDEGCLGTLDAIAAGVPTIVTAQGFHLDLGKAIDEFFVEYDELKKIFVRLQTEVQQRTAVAGRLTWAEYANHHAQVWRAIVSDSPLPNWESESLAAVDFAAHRGMQRGAAFWLAGLRPRRLLSALGHTRALMPLRNAWRSFQRGRSRTSQS